MTTLIAVSCAGNAGSFKTDVFSFADTTAYCCTSLSVELPSGQSAAESAIRDSLISFLDAETRFGEPGKATLLTRPEISDLADMQACIDLYGQRVAGDINKAADEEESFYPWEFQAGISMSRLTEKYAVFNCTGYQYLGGAHGGITGSGPHTFSLKTGAMIRQFIEDSALTDLQGEFRKGLLRYFKECGEELTEDQLSEQLFIEDGIIPFPACQPEPTEEGLVFTYKQYEIAPYATGMPSFCLPYNVVKPYLTAEAKEIL